MEIDGLKALNVFVDSSVFIGKNYRYGHPSFVALKDAVLGGRANLLITDVTIEEVKAHIDDDISKSALQRLVWDSEIIMCWTVIEKWGHRVGGFIYGRVGFAVTVEGGGHSVRTGSGRDSL